MRLQVRRVAFAALAFAPLFLGSAHAQDDRRYSATADSADHSERGGLFGLFGGSAPSRPAPRPQYAQVDAPDLAVRLERLENQIRQLTGSIEQLQFRNQQLEQQLRRVQEDTDFRLRELGGGKAPPPQRHSQQAAPAPAMAAAPPPPPEPAPAPGVRRSDAFDPDTHPDAPGSPRSLGSPRSASTPVADAPPPVVAGDRPAGAPLDLGTLSDVPEQPAGVPPVVAGPPPEPRTIPGALPPPPPRNPSATGRQVLAAAPTNSPRDEFALAQGYVQRRDYALAEEGFREFLKRHPNDRLVPDAHYWLGESLYQRQRYRDAAESFLTVSTKYDKSGKAPEALLRLGQSLAALGEREAACATLGEVGRKYPRAVSAKQNAEREQKRARC